MRILSLNCWSEGWDYEKRWPLLSAELAGIKPDVACFQEVFQLRKAAILKKALGYPTLVMGDKKSGLALLTRYRKTAGRCLKFKTKSPKEKYSRYALWVRLAIEKKEWDFFITHLSWRSGETKIRQNQIAELWDFIEKNNGGKRPCVLAGDMNSVAASDEMKFLAGKKWIYVSQDGIANVIKAHQAFRDTFIEANGKSKNTWSHKNPYTLREDLPERRIDYIWFRGSGKPQQIQSSQVCFDRAAGKIFPSDHFGVVTEIK